MNRWMWTVSYRFRDQDRSRLFLDKWSALRFRELLRDFPGVDGIKLEEHQGESVKPA